MIAAYSLYDTNRIISILLNHGITYEILKRVVASIDLLKNDVDKSLVKAEQNLYNLCKLIYKYFAYDDFNLILTKLVTIVIEEKNTFIQLEENYNNIKQNVKTQKKK